jgi:ribosomal protein S18 acetylase RimI-like enzyme
MNIQILTDKNDILALLPLIQQLSPAITHERLYNLLDDMLRRGYRLVTVWEEGTCVGLSGIWVGTKIYSGKYLEMDNVVVADTHRSKGIGKILTDYIQDLAVREGVEMLMLDAYRENEKAHAFYERQGFVKRGFHFLKRL